MESYIQYSGVERILYTVGLQREWHLQAHHQTDRNHYPDKNGLDVNIADTTAVSSEFLLLSV